MPKQLIKTIKTKNHTLALSVFRKYNSDEYPDVYATIAKKKGGDKNKIEYYIISVYQFSK